MYWRDRYEETERCPKNDTIHELTLCCHQQTDTLPNTSVSSPDWHCTYRYTLITRMTLYLSLHSLHQNDALPIATLSSPEWRSTYRYTLITRMTCYLSLHSHHQIDTQPIATLSSPEWHSTYRYTKPTGSLVQSSQTNRIFSTIKSNQVDL